MTTTYHASNPAFEEEIRQSFAQQKIMDLIAAEMTVVEPGVIEIALPYRADLTQHNGYVHAGIITAIADTACGYAAYTLMPVGSDVLAVEFKVDLLRTAKGELFVARAEVVKPGRTLTVVRAEVIADKSRLVATMQGTMMRLPRRSE
jgi:uncharacterized protein (TIGR00369 family)